jgi:DNA (cytosine-5)-methyltransferase 1
MVNYTCETCLKVFSQKGHLEGHRNRKRPCKRNNTIEVLVQQALSKTNGETAVPVDTPVSHMETDYSKKTREELIALCKERNIKGYSGKKKEDIVKLLTGSQPNNKIIVAPPVNLISEKLKMIDLFAGTGAFTLAFQETSGVDIVFGNDMVNHSKQIYDENFSHKLTLRNLNEIKVEDIPSHDILTGGFPCQPFSIAGKQEGFQDTRSNVFWKILEILDYHKPRAIVLENVRNLVSHDNGNTFKIIKENLEDRGYHLKYKVLDTADLTGIPQHRERIYIVGLRNKELSERFSLDFPKVPKQSIASMLQDTVPDKYYYKNSSSTWPLLSEAVKKHNTIYQYRRVYVRENKSNECPTLTANMGGGGHNVPIVLDERGIRKLTPRECFNFQGFPQTYNLPSLSDTNLYKLAGNAVSVPVVRLIAKRLVGLLAD